MMIAGSPRQADNARMGNVSKFPRKRGKSTDPGSNVIRLESAIDRMCRSFTSLENRKNFKAFPEACCRSFGLNQEQIEAVTDLDVVRMLKLGGSIEQIDKLTGIYGLNARKIGAQQSGKTLEEFKSMLTRL